MSRECGGVKQRQKKGERVSVTKQTSLIAGRNVRFVRVRHPNDREMGYFASIGQMPSLRPEVDFTKPTIYVRTDSAWLSEVQQDVGEENVEDIDEATVLQLFPEDQVRQAVTAVDDRGQKSAYLGKR